MKLTLTNLRSDYKLIYKVQPNTAMRIAALIEFVKIENQCRLPDLKSAKRVKILALCRGLDISLRTLFRWRAAYLKGGIIGIARKRAPGRRAVELSENEQFLVKEMRMKYRWGAEVIQAHLLHDHSIKLSKYRIERFLNFSGLRDKYPCTTKKVRRRPKKEHTRVVKIHNPGEHTQIDTKHQPHLLKDGRKCYVFNFIDHASNWSYKRAYSSLKSTNVVDFMKRLMAECPFQIKRIQSDNGTEYTYKFYKRYADIEKEHPFEKFCKARDIKHKLIPPGMKELQGLVERSHRQDDQELFSRIEPNEVNEFNEYLEEYCEERNKGRRFKKLGWRTADEWLNDYLVVSLATAHNLNMITPKRDEDLLPIFNCEKMPKSSDQVTRLKIVKSANSCNEKEKSDDKIDIKKAS